MLLSVFMTLLFPLEFDLDITRITSSSSWGISRTRSLGCWLFPREELSSCFDEDPSDHPYPLEDYYNLLDPRRDELCPDRYVRWLWLLAIDYVSGSLLFYTYISLWVCLNELNSPLSLLFLPTQHFFMKQQTPPTTTKKPYNTQHYDPPNVVRLYLLYTYWKVVTNVLDVPIHTIAWLSLLIIIKSH